MSIEQQIGALVEASNDLTKVVNGKIGEIDKRIDDADDEYRKLLSNIQSEFPFYRLTKNQELKINGTLTPGTVGTPDGWHNRNSNYHKCEIVAQSESGIPAVEKHPVIQQFFNDIFGYVPQHNRPNFAVLRIRTEPNALPSQSGSFYTIYQGPILTGVPHSIGVFIKAESGDVRFSHKGDSAIVPVDGKWHERVVQSNMVIKGASYTHAPHFYIEPGASCLIALPAVVAGKVPVGKWGFINKPLLEHEG
ncbi:hypothetical protein [Photobacterium minamisatsumaniensis]|uniref:hypothetical protein n=1 Tax=Photobacterium minamisatsumaniensis TaxID=2910233 RepID=UPI003D0D07EB